MKKSQVQSPKSKVGPALVLVLACLVLFCQKPLSSPGLVIQDSPADSAVLRASAVTFRWQAAERATAYELQVATDAKLGALVSDDTIEVESLQVNVGPDDRYYWRVRPRSADSVWGDWSDTRRFDLERFRVVASLKTQGYPHDLTISGGRAYVADGQAGLAVFDVADPAAPALLGTKMDSMNVAWGVAASDSYAYITYGSKELYIVNVSRPESLKVTGELEYPQPGYGYDVAVRDSFVFLAADAQFIVVNVAQPAYPNLAFQYRYPRDCRGVSVQGNWCYLACGQLGVAVWKVESLPPRQVASFDTPANALSVAVSGNYLYVADTRNGLVVADVSDPLNPRPVATLALFGYARHVSVTDSLAYVSCEAGGLAVVNVARPEQPVLAATVSLPYTMCAQAEDGYVFAGDRDSGLVVIKLEE
jgi:hypothetical protein